MVAGDLLTFYPVDRNGNRPAPLELIVCHRKKRFTVISAVMNFGIVGTGKLYGRELGTRPIISGGSCRLPG